MPLSVAIITRNAASQLESCLASVAFAEEVVVVDSGSTDGTVELAARRGARVIAKDWLGFGPQKQFAVESARHDWVLCLDADERLSESLREAALQPFPRPLVETRRRLSGLERAPFPPRVRALERRCGAREGRHRASDPATARRPP